MKRVIVAPADLAGAPLAELKQWLAISTATQDALLLAHLRAALDMCEAFTGNMPLEAGCEETLPATREWRALATRPVIAMTDVLAVPAEGPAFALDPADYRIDIDAEGTGMVQVLRQGAAGRIRVRFTAGLAPGWSVLPDAIRQGIVRLAAHQFRERDSGASETPPAAIVALWRPWRRMRLA